MRGPALEVENLVTQFKTFDGVLRVLDGVNLWVEEGEQVGLVGESGCGKTTLGRCVVRLVRPSSGRLLIRSKRFSDPVDIVSAPQHQWKHLRKEIQVIFQDPSAALNPVFSVGDQLMAAIRYGSSRALRGRQLRDAALSALQDVQLPDPERLMASYPFQLSGGMRQRVCIAMALAARPALLIADEPTTALDVTIQDQILRLLKNLVEEQETSVLMITHNLGVAREMVQRVCVMYAGTVVEDARTEELFARPLHPYTVGLLRAVPKLTGWENTEGIPGRIPNYLDPPEGCRFHPRCTEANERCSEQRPPMAEVDPTHRVACGRYAERSHG